MFDPAMAFQLAAVAGAAAVGIVFGVRKAGSGISRHNEEQMTRLVQMQKERIDLLERDRDDRIRENSELRERILHLEARVEHLEAELVIEKRITARLDKEKP